ncbi:hypothetical protein DYST_03569 [Dyella terrae]|nr:hypothetical protein DYST_03569 [Dyella terrae]
MFMRRLAIAILGSAFLSVPSLPAVSFPVTYDIDARGRSARRSPSHQKPGTRPKKHNGHVKNRKARSRRRRHRLQRRS